MKLKNAERHFRFLKGPGLALSDKIKLLRRVRYKPFELNFFGRKIRVVDSGSFLGVYREMFVDQIYRFSTSAVKPVIIDCGSNIGLSVIYFKQLFPEARITALEADPAIFSALRFNVEAFGLQDVELINKAVWIRAEDVKFQVEGGASGMISQGHDAGQELISVPGIRLQDVLQAQDRIDFLKIDIEGAESEVIIDCNKELTRAERIFVEYHSFADRAQQLGEILAILRGCGFRIHITEAFTSPHPFIGIKTMLGMDLLLNIYAWKE